MIKRKSTHFIMTTILTVLLSGCNTIGQFSPEKVISNALADEREITYYGEMEADIKGIDELSGSEYKEWRGKDKFRIEYKEEDGNKIIIVYDGESMITYDEGEKKATKVDGQGEVLQELALSPKEQIESLFTLIRDTHDIKTVGSEKIAGRDTFHIIAKKKENAKTLFGDQELWIDKESWLVLKIKIAAGGTENELTYTKIEFEPQLDDDLFQITLPEDIKVEEMDTLLPNMTDTITLAEVPTKFEQNVLYIPDTKAHEMDTITYTEIDGNPGYADVTIDYKCDGLPLLSLTIMEMTEEEEKEQLELLDGHAEQVNVRQTKGYSFSFNEFQSITWQEAGLSYALHMIDPKLTVDDLLSFTEEMIEIKTK